MWPGTVLSTSQIPIHLIQKKKKPPNQTKNPFMMYIFLEPQSDSQL